ncbi:hypothetical protein ACQJBY_066741 [Aegilops geniculata]
MVAPRPADDPSSRWTASSPPRPAAPAAGQDPAADEAVAAGLPVDLGSLIASMLPSAYDRGALEGVSSCWRAAVRDCPVRPLPLIMSADLRLTDCFGEGNITRSMHPRLSQSSSDTATALGSLKNWVILGFEPKWNPAGDLIVSHRKCVLFQPLKGTLRYLPDPSASVKDGLSGTCRITQAEGILLYSQPATESGMFLQKIVLSDSCLGPDFRVAGLAASRGSHHLALCTADMDAWCVCTAPFLTLGSDLEFIHDKLYVLGGHQEDLYQIEFGAEMVWFPHVCAARRCVTMQLPQDGTHEQRNLVRSRNDLLLVVRSFNENWDQLVAVTVFKLNVHNWTWTQVHALHGQSLLISMSSSVAIDFSAYHEVEYRRLAERVYFLDQFCPGFLPGRDDRFTYQAQFYDMLEGQVTELLIGGQPASWRPGFPMWFSPTE